MATQGGDDGGGGGGGGLVHVPPAAGPGLVGDPRPAAAAAAAAAAPAPAVHEEEAKAEEDPAAVAGAAAAALVAVPPQEKGHFVSVISRYFRDKQYIHLEYFLKSFIQNLYYEETADLEHVQLVLGSRMANVANIAKVEGYDHALEYFESQIRPLMASKSPYANHGNKKFMINKIESALREKIPVLFDTEALKTSMCDYIRFNFPSQVGYPASEGRRSKLYEFVFPVADKRYRCLLCQQVWSSRPSSFLEKHFKGKEPCTQQTHLSKDRYNNLTNVKEKRKAESSVSSNLKLKEIKLVQMEEDQKMEDETEKPEMHQLIIQGRECIQKLAGPFLNNNGDAFLQVQNEMRHIFTSMEKVWTSQSSQMAVTARYPDGQFSHMPANWDPAQQTAWEDYVENVNTGRHVSQDVPVHTEPSIYNNEQGMRDEAEQMISDDDWFADDGLLSRNRNAIMAAAAPGEGVGATASEELPVHVGATEPPADEQGNLDDLERLIMDDDDWSADDGLLSWNQNAIMAEAAPGEGVGATASEELPVHVGATQPPADEQRKLDDLERMIMDDDDWSADDGLLSRNRNAIMEAAPGDGVTATASEKDELYLYAEEPRAVYGEEAQTSPSRGRDGRRAK